MIALVVVSHSEQAANGVAEVATEMGGDARIVPVGGDPDGGIGTSAPEIEDAILDAVEGPDGETADGIVVLVDLGSAVMNAELAIEMLEEDLEVVIADAPILEGTLNAAVSASSPKATLDEVLQRAEEARDYRKLD
ncbi:dihydroxyacetone kinase phosphoryl donor subunit DhaM [Salinarchaeum laminariae]|uniref:dihydroxyacetone kinase phosphoryl donor subunit DhaM n=1 Tax=Salinarchaeum laminariae TaxID=869888 RepID=UPI0020C02504|nr:dihydroxyacetone kinase phosphoryl donor subunit DhaM [Salinarchaeum laminariae]